MTIFGAILEYVSSDKTKIASTSLEGLPYLFLTSTYSLVDKKACLTDILLSSI